MKTTRLGSFSAEFKEVLRELHDTLLRTGSQVGGLPTELGCQGIGAGFEEHARELARLFERLGSERSSVFIFGPHNAGKSTLINALSRRPMVEVSPLPGYPAPVFVEYGERDEVSAERFDGSQLEGMGATAAQIELRRAHTDLASRVRAARNSIESPEQPEGEAPAAPGRGMATGMRRIRVTVSNPDLERARVRFVECPASAMPLFDNYADMLMGAHAGPGIAVYCVRAENLFDESAFRGIEELLCLFKQVHVVVNVDSESRDLSTEGEIVPGLGACEPVRLVEVFEGLCTEPRLLQAIESGHVRFFPIDLLHAAKSAILADPQGQLSFSEPPAEADSIKEPAVAEFEASTPEPRNALAGERGDSDDALPRPMRELERRLSSGLDGSEELSILVKSTLRRAREITGETFQLLESGELARAMSERGRAREAKEQNLEAQATLRRMIERGEREWELEPCFSELRTQLQASARRTADGLRAELGPTFLSLVNDWFESDHTLDDLIRQSLTPRLDEARTEVQRAIALALRAQWNPTRAGFTEALNHDFERTGVDPADHADSVQDGLGELDDPQPLRPVDMDAVVVGAGFFDRLFLRSGARLRRKVLGPPNAPNKPLSSKRKEARFDEAAREALRSNVVERIEAYLTDLCRRLAADATTLQVKHFAVSLRTDAAARLAALDEPLIALEQRIEALEELRRLTESLATVRAASVTQLEPLAARHARADLDVLVPHATPFDFGPTPRIQADPVRPGVD